jgi:hypothetical protein
MSAQLIHSVVLALCHTWFPETLVFVSQCIDFLMMQFPAGRNLAHV